MLQKKKFYGAFTTSPSTQAIKTKFTPLTTIPVQWFSQDFMLIYGKSFVYYYTFVELATHNIKSKNVNLRIELLMLFIVGMKNLVSYSNI